MPLFLTDQQIYRIIQRELPEGVYPDGPATGFYSTADSFATAAVLRQAYQSASGVYDNYFPNYAQDSVAPLPGQAQFEKLYLNQQLDASIPLQERRNKVIEKIRSLRRTTAEDMKATVYTVVPTSVGVEILPWGCGCDGWILDVSLLDISTVLNEFNNLNLVGPDLCQKTAADYGFTEEEYARYQTEAYAYTVAIYGYTLSATERASLEAALNAAEPARSKHFILDGLDLSDMLLESC